jgi:hypothetical protein
VSTRDDALHVDLEGDEWRVLLNARHRPDPSIWASAGGDKAAGGHLQHWQAERERRPAQIENGAWLISRR